MCLSSICFTCVDQLSTEGGLIPLIEVLNVRVGITVTKNLNKNVLKGLNGNKKRYSLQKGE